MSTAVLGHGAVFACGSHASPSVPRTPVAARRYATVAQLRQLKRAITRFDKDADRNDGGGARTIATDEAVQLTGLAEKSVHGLVSDKFVAASDAWVKASEEIGAGSEAQVSHWARVIQQRDAALGPTS